MKPVERGLLDKFFNGYLLGKRKIDKAYKFYTPNTQLGATR